MLQENSAVTHTMRRKRSLHAFTPLLLLLLVLPATREVWSEDPTMVSAHEKFGAGNYKEAASLLQAALDLLRVGHD